VILNDQNIIFIGFMGVGKTTVGQLVAQKLNRKFIDTDEEIEKEYGIATSEIFKKFGEKVFREKEKSLIISLCKQKNLVVSLGGGAFLQEEIRNACLSSCIVIFLNLSFEKWSERINLIIESRPVLNGKSIEEMKELFYKRQEIYSNHHIKIDTDNKEVEDIADQIIKLLENRRLQNLLHTEEGDI
jgi:shikimate kinase